MSYCRLQLRTSFDSHSEASSSSCTTVKMASKFLSLAVLALLAASAFAQGSTTTKVNAPAGTEVKTQSTPQGTNTQVKAPGTEVKNQGANTQVKAPGTKVESTPQGTVVNAPGTKVVSTPQVTGVKAPGTTVLNNPQTGATSVSAPGTKVDVAPNGATRVRAPFVGEVIVPGNGGRKMLQA